MLIVIDRFENQGVHSLTDVPVFAMGPCQELFGGVYGNIDIFFNMAECLGLGRASNSSVAIPSGSSTSPTASAAAFTGASGKNSVENKLWVGMIAFQFAIGWVMFKI